MQVRDVEKKVTDSAFGADKTLVLFGALLSGLVTLLVYIPALQNDFVNWDDNEYILEEPDIRRIDLYLIKKIFTKVFLSNWHPLTTFSYALDYSIWSTDPFGYHLVNIVMHALNTFLVFFLAVRLTSRAGAFRGGARDPGPGILDLPVLAAGAVAALLFGLHPLHVESVAWVSERKDVLCGFFFILSILSYLKYGNPVYSGRALHYTASLVFFALALLAKPMAITLPVVLLILDYYPLERFAGEGRLSGAWKAVSEKAPFFLLSAASALLTVWAQREGHAFGTLEEYPPGVRVLVAVRSSVFYLYKMAVPTGLAPIYPYPAGPELYNAALAASIVIFSALTAFSILMLKKSRSFSAAWFYYLATLAPVIGIVQVGSQSAADRYTYLPSLAVFILAGAAVGRIIDRPGGRALPGLVAALTVIVSVILSVLTVSQIRVWKDSVTLWTREIETYPGKVFLAYHQRALANDARGDYGRALEDYNTAIALGPKYGYMYNNRGHAFEKAGDLKKALEDLNTAVGLIPKNPGVYMNRASVYQRMGERGKAIADLDSAIALNPGDAKPYTSRGFAYDSMGEAEKALADYDTAISLDPSYAYPYNNRGFIYHKLGRRKEAVEDFNRAIALDPSFASPYNNRGLTYRDLGDNGRAIEDFSMALKLDPGSATSYLNRGVSYGELGRFEKAIEDFSRVLKLEPGNAYAFKMRGFAHLKTGDFKKAQADLERSGELYGEDAEAHLGLGVACYNLGDRKAAAEHLKKASRLGSKEALDFMRSKRLY
ncbi:MAG: tetratricopeptide repeat protein [Deltaproteobacteria bacterium]|nr:tetratricopeptide repeat protein [Deltaproteobacteria bacterium]